MSVGEMGSCVSLLDVQLAHCGGLLDWVNGKS